MENSEFMPKLSNIHQVYSKSDFALSPEDNRKLQKLHFELNSWALGLSAVWGVLLGLDIRNFYMREKATILKVFRGKYHFLSALGLGYIYFYLDFKKGSEAIDILARYDLRFMTLKHPNNAF